MIQGDLKAYQAPFDVGNLSGAGLGFLIKLPLLCIRLLYWLCSTLTSQLRNERLSQLSSHSVEK
jgi:hypothetical protein